MSNASFFAPSYVRGTFVWVFEGREMSDWSKRRKHARVMVVVVYAKLNGRPTLVGWGPKEPKLVTTWGRASLWITILEESWFLSILAWPCGLRQTAQMSCLNQWVLRLFFRHQGEHYLKSSGWKKLLIIKSINEWTLKFWSSHWYFNGKRIFFFIFSFSPFPTFYAVLISVSGTFCAFADDGWQIKILRLPTS